MRRARAAYRHGPPGGQHPLPAVDRPPLHAGSREGTAAARKRVEAILDRLARIDLQLIVVAPPDAMRQAARERARTAAVRTGRAALLAEAVDAARETSVRAFARGGFSGTWAATDMGVSVMRASDRVAAAAAFEEAAIAEVVEDLVDEHTLEVLRASAEALLRLKGLPTPGSLSNIAASRDGVTRRPLIVFLAILLVPIAFVLWIGVGAWSGLITLAVGIGIIGSLVRNERRPLD